MNITIIGASGFLGNTMAEQYAELGHRVDGMDMNYSGLESGNYHFHRIDLCQDEVDIPPGTDVVYYLAQSPYYQIFPEMADHLFGVNVVGVIKAVKAAIHQNVRLFCFASTGSVYVPSFLPLKEDAPVRRDNPYALSKVMAEEVLGLFSTDMQIVTTRFFGIFGPNQNKMLPASIFNAVKNGSVIYLQATGKDRNDHDGLRMSFTFSYDIARILFKLGELSIDGIRLPNCINVAAPDPVSIRHFAETIGTIIGKKPLFQIAKNARQFDLIADICKLKSLIKPDFTPFEKAMRVTYQYL